MRRVLSSLALFGLVSLLAAWLLFHVERYDTSACTRSTTPCDPAGPFPLFGGFAIDLVLVGVIALFIVGASLIVVSARGLLRHDARVRAVRRGSAG